MNFTIKYTNYHNHRIIGDMKFPSFASAARALRADLKVIPGVPESAYIFSPNSKVAKWTPGDGLFIINMLELLKG